MNGVTITVKVAHMRLCHSRMFIARALSPRDAGDGVRRARARLRLLQGRLCARHLRQHEDGGRYDLRRQGPAVQSPLPADVLTHHLVDPVACTPASGCEKGQVENQVGLVRERFFTPRLRFKTYDELNAWLMDKCIAYAKAHAHPERPDTTVWAAFEEERPHLFHRGRVDGFHALPASVSKTCLVRFDNNKYSVNASAVGRPGRDPGLRRPDRNPPGWAHRRRAFPLLRTRRDRLRSLALRAGARPQARSPAQRGAIQGLGFTGGAGAGAAQTRGVRRRRPPDGLDSGGGADRWLARGRGPPAPKRSPKASIPPT